MPKPRSPEGDDRTSLTLATDGRAVHRDYAAHFFRWSFIPKFMNPDLTLLDVGCGSEVPLRHVLIGKARELCKLYVGVDLNTTKPGGHAWSRTHPHFDFINRWKEIKKEYGQFDRVVCFEVIEHVSVARGEELLKGIRACVKPEGLVFLSTPVFNGKAANNHVHEYTIEELARALKKAGFTVQARYGTFANYPVLKKVIKPPVLLEVYEKLREYHSDEALSNFLAPLYPDHSRNNVWVLKPKR